jgi:hypothetical protein
MSLQTVADLEDDDEWTLVDGSHERDHVLETIGKDPSNFSGQSLFVKVGAGEYTDVVSYPGSVPYLHKSLTRIL